jgi:hypothetical protein
METFLIGPIDRFGGIVCRAVFDPLTIDIEVHQFIRPIDLSCQPRRDQDLLPGPPVLRVNYEVMDAPIGILHKEVLDVTNLPVAGLDMVPSDRFDAAEMRVIAESCSLQRGVSNEPCGCRGAGGVARGWDSEFESALLQR